MVEGYGYYGTGKSGDPNGALVNARLAMDAGEYQRIGELTPGVATQEAPTLMTIQQQHESERAFAHQVIRGIKSKQETASQKK